MLSGKNLSLITHFGTGGLIKDQLFLRIYLNIPEAIGGNIFWEIR
jgi:hypothetical protein